MAEPALDLRNTFLSTYHVLEAMRRQYVRRFVFTSSSAVYGRSEGGLTEDTGPLLPISNYGAMKLASEALISSAAEMFLANAIILRLPNVVGPRASHGLIFDLFSKLREAPPYLEVLGDGRQQKQYLHITELVDAMTFISGRCNEGLHLLNIGPDDDGITVQQIAEMLLKNAGTGIPVRYTGGEQGWPGDVPRFRYSVRKLAKLGWSARMGSVEAVQRAIVENLSMGAGRK
jgi:UDP-glucose 4-epimerase